MSVERQVRGTEEFEQIVVTVLARVLGQQGQVVADPARLRACATRLADLIATRGLPRPLAPGECGAPGGMAEAETGALVAVVLGGGATEAALAEAVKQLVKACFYPEFTACRDSYREVARDGACRRQQPERVRSRISGTHCVDCPHWVALEPEAHRERLSREWLQGPEAFARDRELFLPEDFRILRRWLWRAARSGVATDRAASGAGGR